MTIGESIKVLLQEQKKSQADLARYLGVSSNTVNRWIPTKKKEGITPNSENIVGIADFFKVDIDVVLGETEPYGSGAYIKDVKRRKTLVKSFESVLTSMGYSLEYLGVYDDETSTIDVPKEVKLSRDGDERFIPLSQFDNMLRKFQKHMEIEIENYY